MRLGHSWRAAVLASLAVLVSGQLCMLTTCVPRLTHPRASAAHACCRASVPASNTSADAEAPESSGAMPCNMALHQVSAPALDAAAPATLPVALHVTAALTLAPPACVAIPASTADTGPPLDRLSPAPAGLRAPPAA